MNKDIFKTSEEREWILQEVKPFLHKKASFQCFHDGIFVTDIKLLNLCMYLIL